MPTKLKALHCARDSKILNYALILCATEVAVLFSAILLDLSFGRRLVITRISALCWVVCGAGSIALSIVGLIRGPNRSAAVSVVALCIVMFILCASRFALV
jgi:hypothetical protein